MQLAVLKSSRLTRIQVLFYAYALNLIFNWQIFFALRLLAKKMIFPCSHQSEYLICYQQASHKGSQSTY